MAKAEAPARGDSGKAQAVQRHGAEARAADARICAARLHVPAGVKGVVVTGVADDSPLADIGVAARRRHLRPSISSR